MIMKSRSRWRQLFFLIRLEFKRYWRGRRLGGIFVLWIAPLLILAVPAVLSGNRGVRPPLPIGYTQFFQMLWLHLVIFFSCASVFSQLFRSEVQEKTLHYYYMVRFEGKWSFS